MLDYISVNHIEKVMVTELSRLGRDTVQVLEVIERLNESECRFILTTIISRL